MFLHRSHERLCGVEVAVAETFLLSGMEHFRGWQAELNYTRVEGIIKHTLRLLINADVRCSAWPHWLAIFSWCKS
jgi:hypothetical protein